MKKLIIFVFLVLFVSTIESQVKYVVSKVGSKAVVEGSSTLHDWEMTGADFKSSYVANFKNGQLQNIQSVSFIIPSKSLKSKEGKVMDKKAYNALKADKHPQIVFKGVKVYSFKIQNNKFSGIVEGKLSLAGVTRVEKVYFTGIDNSGEMKINASKKLKMSNYKITPPTAVMGTIKCGDELTLKFDLKYSK